MTNSIIKAINILHHGGLVAIPTETVYGLAADAKNVEAVKKIFQAKGRPSDHPVIVHIGDISQLSDWAVNISDDAMKLAKHFWPGPLTLILQKKPGVSDVITGGQNTIGIRIPNHAVTLELLKQFGGGVAAPSANRFGRISPTTAEAVREELGDKVDLILDGGACDVGVESIIVDVSTDDVKILRPGMISAAEIESILQKKLSYPQKNFPRVSGSHETHYAPLTKTFLIDSEKLVEFLEKENDFPVAVVTRQKMKSSENIFVIEMSNDVKPFSHDLYQTLRDLDKKQFKKIIIESVPGSVEWDAVRDRLRKASYHTD
jgi:L-threonylcarbamoyladenylate synthase